jgi:uncharacterized membrane protein YqhA
MTADSPPAEQPKHWFLLKNIGRISRILVIVAIIGLLIASVFVILAGFAQLVRIFSFMAYPGFLDAETGKFLSVTVTEMIDLYLIGLVLIIFAVGLYQLFIDPDVAVPDWMYTDSLDILKARLLIVIAVVLAVSFLGFITSATEATLVAAVGIATSLVIIAIGYILGIASRGQIERKKLEIQGTPLQGTDQDQ